MFLTTTVSFEITVSFVPIEFIFYVYTRYYPRKIYVGVTFSKNTSKGVEIAFCLFPQTAIFWQLLKLEEIFFYVFKIFSRETGAFMVPNSLFKKGGGG